MRLRDVNETAKQNTEPRTLDPNPSCRLPSSIPMQHPEVPAHGPPLIIIPRTFKPSRVIAGCSPSLNPVQNKRRSSICELTHKAFGYPHRLCREGKQCNLLPLLGMVARCLYNGEEPHTSLIVSRAGFHFRPSHWAEGYGHRKGKGIIKILTTERANKQLDRGLQSGPNWKPWLGM